MKEFSKIGDYYVKDAQARSDIATLQTEVDALKTGGGNGGTEGGSGENTGGGSSTPTPTPTNPLPEVSAEDNGKVLKVVDGVWAKSELPEPTKKTWTFTLEDGTTLTEQVHVG
jgi:hypothetical protein